MVNCVDTDQTAALGAVWSGFTLFAYEILSDTLVCKISGHDPYTLESPSTGDLNVAHFHWENMEDINNICLKKVHNMSDLIIHH